MYICINQKEIKNKTQYSLLCKFCKICVKAIKSAKRIRGLYFYFKPAILDIKIFSTKFNFKD